MDVDSFAPGLDRILRYERSWLRADLIGGVTVASYLIPQVMAYAEVAGLPPVTGLWSAVGAATVYAVFGSSRQLSVGPETTTALMTAAAIAPLAAGSPGRHAALAALLAIMTGLIFLVARLARFGFLADLFSKPVLVGYLAGVAVLMILSQLTALIGVESGATSHLEEITGFVSSIGQAHLPTVALGVVALSALFLGARLFPTAPTPLIVVLVAAAAVAVFGLGERGVDVVGAIPSGLPAPSVPALGLSDVAMLLLPALGLTMVAFTDSSLNGRAFANRGRYSIDSNQELLALGGANLAAGLLQGFPVSSSGTRTSIGAALGTRSQLHALIAVGVVVGVLLFLGPVLSAFPRVALAALVVWAATRLVDLSELRRFGRFRRSELQLALATTAGVLLVGILYGIAIAIALSVIDMLRRAARPHDGVLGYVPGVAGMHDIEDYPNARQVPGLVVYRYDAPLFFANADDFRRRALEAVDAAGEGVEWFLLNFEANVQIDVTAIDALDQLHEELDRRGIVMALARVKFKMRSELEKTGFVDRVGSERVFATLPIAVSAYIEEYTAKHGRPPPGVVARRPPEPPILEWDELP